MEKVRLKCPIPWNHRVGYDIFCPGKITKFLRIKVELKKLTDLKRGVLGNPTMLKI